MRNYGKALCRALRELSREFLVKYYAKLLVEFLVELLIEFYAKLLVKPLTLFWRILFYNNFSLKLNSIFNFLSY